ncbi:MULTISPECIES: carbamoyl-phosphate synthase large subunit [Legionella]|uniref:Ornithine carbamoyltransferase n=1 Tax=Legionella drozanskii LLAP-1 TaxID=1212489 RepID=A0A0W0SV75_9GAMM|nr:MULTISPECIES: carbamoyl-phosphate synthase large subunit [Legionella]KTC87279.1 carbamoyl-phosphate synthase large subunit [Legionella drozanskii LLAP-1]PJE17911.1 MAG: carbamoyl phosphate synthase large subunit [Legionella sp.]
MPKNTKIKSILVIGSGPINIGQACEFDYSGTQALKALREEGYRVILVNSNPATIMTDPELADATYIEPITSDYVSAIIDIERPDALVATLGGQTSLNCALELHRKGILAKYEVELIGASIEAIRLAEDRTLFHQKMIEIGLDVPKSQTAKSIESAIQIMQNLGLPLMIRSSFSLGGSGAALVHSKDEALAIFKQAFAQAGDSEITIDEALIGWKEFELEVVRDTNDNCIVVCGVENVDPLGIHTGDSITVAPIQTLTDDEYQAMRDAAFAVLRAVGVETGGSNVQFAINPRTGRMVVIEMNPRVSRSSALVSKATGFPIAKIAAKLAVGYTLDELRNEITADALPASFEPSIDYTVVKIPRFHDEKFNAQGLARGPQMRSVGEVMAIGSTFAESLQNAILSLEINASGLNAIDAISELDDEALSLELKRHTAKHLWCVAESFRRGFSVEEIHAACFIDPWFLQQIKSLVDLEQTLQSKTLSDLDQSTVLKLKKQGFSDQRIAQLTQSTEAAVRQYRQQLTIHPVYKCVDSCAGEFKTETAYLYSTYQDYCESKRSDKAKIMILGSGPNRIGQGIEFDYVCVKAIQAFAAAGFETIMVNCNPETVSTDYDVASKLYFVPLTYEKVLDLIEKEQPQAIALQFGGQTPLNLLDALHQAGVPLLGLTSEIVNITEDRDLFSALVQRLNLKQPKNRAINHLEELDSALKELQFPLIIRPSFVLGGRGMEIVSDKEILKEKLSELFKITTHAVLLEEFLAGAIEVDVDAVSDGEDLFIPTVLEHIEAAGVHSGDSACITPPYRLSPAMINLIHQQTKKLARALNLKGLMNVQYAVKDSEVFLIEVNPRASRTTPFICKATGIPLVEIAVKCLLGHSLKEQHCLSPIHLPYYCVKEAVLPFRKFQTSSPILSPEMKGTGEVMGIGQTPYEAYLKAQIAAGHDFSLGQSRQVLVSGLAADDELLITLKQAGFTVVNQLEAGTPDVVIAIDGARENLSYALQHNLPYISTREAAVMVVRSLINHAYPMLSTQKLDCLQTLYQQIKHPSKTRHVLTGLELTVKEIKIILKLAAKLKQNPEKFSHLLVNKNLALIFEKPSFRTRLSFTRAIQSLGGTVIESVSSTRKSEEPRDLIRVLNGYCDAVMIRTHEDEVLEEMARYATVPIINGLSALYHPCQILADLLTLQEYFGQLEGLTLAYIGDGNNILHTLLALAPQLGIKINYCCPPTHQPNAKLLNHSLNQFEQMIDSHATPKAAVHDAHAVYTDVWTSMGFEHQRSEELFAGLQVNEALMAQAKPEAIFMHCMPMERGKEVSLTLPDEPASAIFAQSENRLHVQKALLVFLLGRAELGE